MLRKPSRSVSMRQSTFAWCMSIRHLPLEGAVVLGESALTGARRLELAAIGRLLPTHLKRVDQDVRDDSGGKRDQQHVVVDDQHLVTRIGREPGS